MASLQSLLATSLSPSEEHNIASTATQTLGLMMADQSLLQAAPETTLHKFNVRVSALLKGSAPASKWLGAHLARVACETNMTALKSHGAIWANILVHIVELPSEHAVVKEAAIEALEAMFTVTKGKQELTREITTPRIPNFVKVLLKLTDSIPVGSDLMLTVIKALNGVMKSQSTTFKPYAQRYEKLSVRIIAASYTEPHKISKQLLDAAAQGFVLLHFVTTKGNEQVLWRKNINRVISELHIAIGQLTQDVIDEDSSTTIPLVDANTPRIEGLPTVNNYFELDAKLTSLFSLLTAFLKSPTKTDVKLPVGSIMNLADRAYSITSHSVQKRGIEKHIYSLFIGVSHSLHILTTSLLLALSSIVKSSLLLHFDLLAHHLEVLTTTSPSSIDLHLPLLSLASVLFEATGVLPTTHLALAEKLVITSLDLTQPRVDPSSAHLPDAVANPALFILTPSRDTLLAIIGFLRTIIAHVPDLALPARARIDQWLILESQSHSQSDSNVRKEAKEALALSAFCPGRTTKYSVLPMALNAAPQSWILDSMVHPRLPPTGAAVHNLFRTAALGRSRTELEDEQEDMEIDNRPVENSSKRSADLIDSNSVGFLSSTNKKQKVEEQKEQEEEEEVDSAAAPMDIELKFETKTKVSKEVAPSSSDNIEITNTELSVVGKDPTPAETETISPVFTHHLSKLAKSESESITANAQTVQSDTDSENDDDELVIPTIVMDSSDDEE